MLWNWLRRIVNSHACKFVPGSNLSKLAKARRIVSCTRSSACSLRPVTDRAKARRLGIAARMAGRRSDPAGAKGCVRLVQAPQQVEEALWYGLAPHLIV